MRYMEVCCKIHYDSCHREWQDNFISESLRWHVTDMYRDIFSVEVFDLSRYSEGKKCLFQNIITLKNGSKK